jgi:hypothetical protein
MTQVLEGAVVMGFVVAALFLIHFWTRTRQALFLLFAIGFALEAIGRLALALEGDPLERRAIFYLPRLLGYLLIIAGIVSKNLPSRPRE